MRWLTVLLGLALGLLPGAAVALHPTPTTGTAPQRKTWLFYDGAGRLRAKAAPEGTLCYSYDPVTGRLSDLQAYEGVYTAAADGTGTWDSSTRNPTQGVSAADVNVSYAYDYAGRLVTVTDHKLTQADKATRYIYDEGRLIGQRYPNELTAVFKYDPLGDLKDLEFHRTTQAAFTHAGIVGPTLWLATPKASLRYTRDFAGQRRRSLESLPLAGQADTAGLKRQFQHKYDLARRLDTEWVSDSLTTGADFNVAPTAGNKATVAYAMNLVGNRDSRTTTGTGPTGSTVPASVSNYIFDHQDRATTVGGLSPTWDKKDNALNPGYGTTYQWDRRNRLTEATTGGTTTKFTYDAEGLRVSKQVGSGATTRYLVDTLNPTGYGQVLAEYSVSGSTRTLARTYTYGLDLISQRTASGGLVEFFSTDALGTTRFLSTFDPTPGATGGINGSLGELTTQTYTYDAYGLLATGSASATAYLYTGEQWDSQVGAYYLRARWYLPEWGRFLSRDSYEGSSDDPLSQNRFLYANGSPVNSVDPSGHIAILSNWWYGNQVHRELLADFTLRGPVGERGGAIPISQILGVTWTPKTTATIPDLFQYPRDGMPGQVYEIKPTLSYVVGRAQLLWYLATLNTQDPLRRSWVAGTAAVYTPPRVIPLSFGVFAFVQAPQNGIILYHVEDLRVPVMLLALKAIEARTTELQMRFGLATLTSTIGRTP